MKATLLRSKAEQRWRCAEMKGTDRVSASEPPSKRILVAKERRQRVVIRDLKQAEEYNQERPIESRLPSLLKGVGPRAADIEFSRKEAANEGGSAYLRGKTNGGWRIWDFAIDEAGNLVYRAGIFWGASGRIEYRWGGYCLPEG